MTTFYFLLEKNTLFIYLSKVEFYSRFFCEMVYQGHQARKVAPARPSAAPTGGVTFKLQTFRESLRSFDGALEVKQNATMVAMFDDIILQYKMQIADKSKLEECMLQMAVQFRRMQNEYNVRSYVPHIKEILRLILAQFLTQKKFKP